MEETEVETVARLQAVDVRDLYPELSAEDASSRVCLLCAAKLKDKTHNLTRHLERHHAGALLQLLEQRSQAPPALLASKGKRAQQDRSSASRQQQQSPAQPRHEAEDAAAVNVVGAKTADAKLALAKWLAQEQLPVELVEKHGFREFVEALNEQFDAPKRDELRSLLGTLVRQPDVHDDVIVRGAVNVSTVAGAAIDAEVETQTGTGPAWAPSVDMMALRATCRCSQDSPLMSCARVACGLVGLGEAKVRVVRAAASLFDAQSCRGKVLGKDGVLGRAFVGVVTELQRWPLPSGRGSNVATTAAPTATTELPASIELQDRVVGSPYLTCAACSQQNPQAQCEHATCVGLSASSGTLAQFLVLPLANLFPVPPSVPDDLALLADDVAVVLAVAAELRTRHATKIAIISDAATSLLTGLLARYLSQDAQLAHQDLHVFSTSASVSSSPSRWTSSQQYATTTSLDIYQPAAVADVLARQQELAIDGCVDLCGAEASAELALSLVHPMGAVLLVDRARLELHPRVSAAMDMNAVVVRELELTSLHDCREQLPAALEYLAAQAQSAERAAELRRHLVAAPVALEAALQELQTISEETLETRYLQVNP